MEQDSATLIRGAVHRGRNHASGARDAIVANRRTPINIDEGEIKIDDLPRPPQSPHDP
ncbi:MAG: hypothetical protein P8K78_05400 [Pirellulales bacterium]|nr:hypothetical protein [Pirellulales bacterium]